MASQNKWDYIKEMWKYYIIKMFLALNLCKIKCQAVFGIKASAEELVDFELDYNE
jgi:hypothetical protein